MKQVDMEFQKKAIKEAEEYYKSVEMDARQRDNMDKLADLLLKYIPLNRLAMRGFMIVAARKWQVKHSKTLEEIALFSEEDRLQAIWELCDNTKIELINALKFETQHTVIEIAIKNAFKFYKENLSYKK
ncbi:MAG: hypothetical protein GY870_01515 [archaeon]|nr:hypothetical protein [archaeon]